MVGHSSKRFVVLQQPEITSLIAKAVSRSSVVTFESEKGCYATHLFPKKGSSEEGVNIVEIGLSFCQKGLTRQIGCEEAGAAQPSVS